VFDALKNLQNHGPLPFRTLTSSSSWVASTRAKIFRETLKPFDLNVSSIQIRTMWSIQRKYLLLDTVCLVTIEWRTGNFVFPRLTYSRLITFEFQESEFALERAPQRWPCFYLLQHSFRSISWKSPQITRARAASQNAGFLSLIPGHIIFKPPKDPLGQLLLIQGYKYKFILSGFYFVLLAVVYLRNFIFKLCICFS
jgi:hypothetical protein